MRRIVDAIRKCPVTSEPVEVMGAITKHTVMVLDWDMTASDSLRAPFKGLVNFKVVSTLEETDESKRSKEGHQRFVIAVDAIRGCSYIQYRYEFALGSAPPELRQALIFFPVIDTGFRTYAPSTGTCWDKIATSPDSAIGTN